MFGKDVSSAGDSKLNSIIGKGSQCEGEIVVAGGLKIDGTFKGKIKADSVFVGKEAVIEATVDTNVAVVGGKVLGDVTARESLELQAKANPPSSTAIAIWAKRSATPKRTPRKNPRENRRNLPPRPLPPATAPPSRLRHPPGKPIKTRPDGLPPDPATGRSSQSTKKPALAAGFQTRRNRTPLTARQSSGPCWRRPTRRILYPPTRRR